MHHVRPESIAFVASSVLALGLLPSSATADVTFNSATRTITATGSNSIGPAPIDTTTDSSSAFGAYDNTVQHQVQSIDEPPGTFQQGYAEQHSFIGVDSLTFAGRVFGVDNAVSTGSGYGVGRSQLTLGFTLTAPTPWSVAFTNTFGPGPTSPTDVFGAGFQIQNSSNVAVVAFDGFFTSNPQTSGILAPGGYTLLLDVQAGHAFTSTGSVGVNYNWTVNIPAPACGALFVLAPLAMRRRRG